MRANIQTQNRPHPPLPLEAAAPPIPRKRSFVDHENDSGGAKNLPSTRKRR
jgi:hypothetical protein